MKRSYSQEFIAKCLKSQDKKAPIVKELTGTLVKKVQESRSAKWNGLALHQPEYNSSNSVKQSPMRWKEYESSRRTINPEFSNEPTRLVKHNSRRSSTNSCSNLTQMISQGYSQDKVGKLNKKVLIKGKVITANAESAESQLASKGIFQAYKGIHTGQKPSIDKPQIVITELSKAKKTSQIYTLPAGPKEVGDEGRGGYGGKGGYDRDKSKIIETTNPCIINKGKIDLSIEKEKLILSFASFYDKNPLKFDQTPTKQGKFRDSQAFGRMYQGKVVENPPKSPKRKRPDDSKDVFKSSIVLC